MQLFKKALMTGLVAGVTAVPATAQTLPDGLHSYLIEFHEAIHSGDSAVLAEFISEDFHATIDGEELDRAAFLERFHQDLHVPLSSYQFEINEPVVSVEGDIVTVRYELAVANAEQGASLGLITTPLRIAQVDPSPEIMIPDYDPQPLETTTIEMQLMASDGSFGFSFDSPASGGVLPREVTVVYYAES